MAYFNSISRLNVPDSMATYINSADPIYGTGEDGNATLDGSSTVLSMTPSSGVYSMTRDLYLQNLTINSDVRLAPNGYRIFVKNVLTFAGNNAIIGFTSGYSTTGSIMQGGAAQENVTHSLGGSSHTQTATAPTAALGGANYFKVPHQAVTGYSVTPSGGPTWLRGGAGSIENPGGGVVIIAARYIAGPNSGTAYIKAPGNTGSTPSASGGGVILIVSSAAALPASISTDVTGVFAGTYNYMQLV